MSNAGRLEVPLYTDFALRIPKRSLSLFSPQLCEFENVYEFLGRASVSGATILQSSEAGILTIAVFSEIKDVSEWYDGTRIKFDMQRSGCFSRLEFFTARKSGVSFREWPPTLVVDVSEFSEVDEGMWLPKQIVILATQSLPTSRHPDDIAKAFNPEASEPVGIKTYNLWKQELSVSEISIKNSFAEELFEPRFPKGTKVYDGLRQKVYTVGDPAETLIKELKEGD